MAHELSGYAHLGRVGVLRQQLGHAWRHYSDSFNRWKHHDQDKLAGALISHWLELEALRMTVSGNAAVENEWCVWRSVVVPSKVYGYDAWR